MSGRHVTPPTPRPASLSERFASRRARLTVLTGLVICTVGLAAAAVGLSSGDGSATASAASCPKTVDLNVLASAAIAAPIKQVASNWTAAGQPIAGACVRVTVTSSPEAAAESTLVNTPTGGPAIWIPDSSLWAQRLTADLSQAPVAATSIAVNPSIASSPLVLVAPATSAKLASLDSAAAWKAAATGTLPLRVLDPLTQSAGLLSLLALRSTAGPSRNLVGLMVRLSHGALATSGAGFGQLATANASVFAASEQSVMQLNKNAPHPSAVALRPTGGTYLLDFPLVQLQHAGDDPLLGRAATEFQRALRSIIGQNVLAGAGFRDSAGDPLTSAPALGSAPIQALAQPTADGAADVLRLWSAAKAASHTLAVIDVSGSMAQWATNGHSKIQLAASAAANAVNFFPDDSAFGLWAFSSAQAGGSPFSALAPVAPLGSTVNGITQRQRLITAAATLPTLVGGDTALYDTALAAFQQIRNTYDPAKVNSVVLLTDGQNNYPAGITLDALLAQLRLLADPARPVPVITIGVGDGADLPALRQISAATGGKTYVVDQADQIRDVFLDAMLQRQCRPNC